MFSFLNCSCDVWELEMLAAKAGTIKQLNQLNLAECAARSLTSVLRIL